MTINQYATNTTNTHNTSLPKTAQERTQVKATTMAAENIDKFDANSVNVNRNFQNSPNRAEEAGIRGYRGRSHIQMMNAVVADFVNHSISSQSGSSFWNNILENSTFTPRAFALNAFNAAEATSAKHDDYWGVEATAERIFTFARTLAGDNDQLFDTMKNAFLKGFNLASRASGNKLPDISTQTRNRVLEMFDSWEKEINARKNPAPVEQ
jgi:hypothetical protein